MAVFIKLSISRRNLTTIGILQLFGVLIFLGIIQKNMETVEIFTDELEWNPIYSADRRAQTVFNQSVTNSRPTWPPTHQSKHAKILTLFTTFKDSSDVIHDNTLRNWAALKSYITPVLFIDSNDNETETWAARAASLGWQIRNLTHTNRGIPVLRHMYMQITKEYDTPFYGYAKADILFDQSLIDDMKLHLAYLSAYEHHGGLLLIGKRTEISLDEFPELSPVDHAMVSKIAQNNGTLSKTYLEDYLITTQRALPWEHTPDFVVGQAGYANWLVVKAQLCNVTVIDASYTLLALHQTASLDASKKTWEFQRCINKKLLGKSSFDCSKGVTECAPFVSHANENGTLKLYKRPDRPSKCSLDYDQLCIEDLDRYSLDDESGLFM